MATKRSAAAELNSDNWNEDEVPEERGTFMKASDDVLEKRVIKSAKRRLAGSEGSTRNAFGSFTGFKTATTTTTVTWPFGGTAINSNTSSTSSLGASTSNGASNTENGTSKPETSLKLHPAANVTSTKKSDAEDEQIFKKSSDYFAKLKGLNESVAQWIKSHVDENPFCILTPIFRDYERYLKEIESNHGSNSLQSSNADKANTNKTSQNVKEAISTEKKVESTLFGNVSNTKETSEWKPEKSIFGNASKTNKSVFDNAEQGSNIFGNIKPADAQKSIFGNKDSQSETKVVFGSSKTESNPFFNKLASNNKSDEADAKTDVKTTSSGFTFSQNVNTSTFSFGQGSTTTTASAGYSFGGAKPFSFGSYVAKPQNTEEKNENEEEEDEPPKPDFKPVTEEDAIFEQRCKVFVKKDGEFSNRGVGTLFLKPTPTGKTQLIVRADTSLGNLLLNTLLTENTPVQRMKKSMVMLVCLPLPDSQPPPTPVLIKVKTEEEAETLFETLNKHKK